MASTAKKPAVWHILVFFWLLQTLNFVMRIVNASKETYGGFESYIATHRGLTILSLVGEAGMGIAVFIMYRRARINAEAEAEAETEGEGGLYA